MADPVHPMADLPNSMADLLHSMADPAISMADLLHSMADRSIARAGGGDFRGRRATFPDDAARAATTAVRWGGAGFAIPAAAALLRPRGEDGVPAVEGAPLSSSLSGIRKRRKRCSGLRAEGRKTAEHKLAGVLLIVWPVRRAGRLRLAVDVRARRARAPEGGTKEGWREGAGERRGDTLGPYGVSPPLSCVRGRAAAARYRARPAT
jgi:hypothetical protein